MSGVAAWLLIASALLLMRGSGARTAHPIRPAAGRPAARAPRSGRRGGRRSRAGADASVPLLLDLTAAALRGGCPLGDALELAAPAASDETAEGVIRVARLLRFGADPAQAWQGIPADGPLAPVVPVAIRSATSGLKLAAAFERLAGEVRAEREAAAAARAYRAGVWAMAPLAACFLPSFVCLGVIPAVVGIASAALGRSP